MFHGIQELKGSWLLKIKLPIFCLWPSLSLFLLCLYLFLCLFSPWFCFLPWNLKHCLSLLCVSALISVCPSLSLTVNLCFSAHSCCCSVFSLSLTSQSSLLFSSFSSPHPAYLPLFLPSLPTPTLCLLPYPTSVSLPVF